MNTQNLLNHLNGRQQFKAVFSELPNDLISKIILIKTTQLKKEGDKKTEAIKNSLTHKNVYHHSGRVLAPDEVEAYKAWQEGIGRLN